jgi:diguanylate cyclase (GGDEF)-like protein/putative nucleotidyltransferase with HDIG domain
MGRQRQRRDQIWNPPSRGTDISAIFVLFAAGPLLLPLIGAQIGVIAFATPLLFCSFATWRCVLAARRSPARTTTWITFAAAVATAAAASVVALLAPGHHAAFYVGTAASGFLALAMVDGARRSLRHVPLERAADGLLFPGLTVSIAAWFVVIPGFRDGDPILTAAVVLDLVALCAAAFALVIRPSAAHMQVAGPMTMGLGLATIGDGLISSDAAGLLSTSGVATALLWAGAAYCIALAADFDLGLAPKAEAGEADLAAVRWVIVRVILPLVAVVIVPLILIALYVGHNLGLGSIVWFLSTFLLVVGLAFGRQAYLLLDNRRSVIRERELRQQVMRRNEELEALTGLATTMTQTLEEDPILERGLGVLHLAARASSSAFFVRRPAGLELGATTGSWPTEHSWAGRAEAPEGGRALTARGGREILRLGLATRGNDLGFVTLMRSAEQPFAQHELDLLGLLGDQLAIAIQNARDYREKLEQAIRDPLTGLYNRRFFYEALEKEVQRSARYGTTMSLVLFDVDDFKAINDSLGHQAGDDSLRAIAAIVDPLIRPVDSFARLGGEEFGLLLPETGQLDALLAAERLRTAISRHKILGDRRVTVSGGVACCPTDATTLEDLERKADAALYWAKRNGKNLCAVSSEVNAAEFDGPADNKLAHLHAVVAMIDAQHLQTHDHSENVAAYAVALGRELGLDVDHVVRLRQAAHFHDIGKVAVSTAVLNKPSALTPEEMAEMRLHPTVGATMLMHAGFPEEAHWVRCHHEWVDGRGYPSRLRGDQIPFESRIILVADAFEAMTSDRPYSPGIAVDDALDELRACAGTQFDPDVVEALVSLVQRGELAVLALKNAAPGPR